MTEQERRVLKNVIRRLEGDGRAAPEIAAFLEGPGRLWLDTWVISPLKLMAKNPRCREDMRLAESLSR